MWREGEIDASIANRTSHNVGKLYCFLQSSWDIYLRRAVKALFTFSISSKVNSAAIDSDIFKSY
jgi:hypothetical protein